MLNTQKLGTQLDDLFHRLCNNGVGDDNESSDADAVIAEVQNFIESLSSLAQTAPSQPVKLLEELRVLGCSTWNLTVRHLPRHEEARSVKVRTYLREFATRAFLLGNFVFSGNEITHSYFIHHPREAEQCVLMCLKTSRDLSLCGVDGASKELLVLGERIASYLRDGTQNPLAHFKHRNVRWEFAYTALDVLWNVRHCQEACEASERLMQMLLREHGLQREHREAFCRLVFTIGNAVDVPTADACHVRTMLTHSLSVQEHFSDEGNKNDNHSRHLRTLRGVTFEQMALSLLREGNTKEAVHWANEADAVLCSASSALLRLRTTAQAGGDTEASPLLLNYVRRPDVQVDDAIAACFELYRLRSTEVGSGERGPVNGMQLLYTETRGSPHAAHVTFRLAQLLLLEGSPASRESALQLLKKDEPELQDPKYRRYGFMWLWELSDNVDFARVHVVESLEAALRFKDCASESEIHAVQLRLCDQLIAELEDGNNAELSIKAEAVLEELVRGKSRCVFTHCLLFKLAVLKQSEVICAKELECLCACEPSEAVLPALCTAINYSIRHSYMYGISLAASRAVFWPVVSANASVEVELLRVYVASVLCKISVSTEDQLGAVACKFHRLLSETEAVTPTHDEAVWWSQAFLTLGSEFATTSSATTVSLFRAAVIASRHDPTFTTTESNALLHAALLCIFEDEFQLFVNGNPQMELCELDELLCLFKESLSIQPSSTEARVTFLLSTAERHLRDEPTANTTEIIEQILMDLQNTVATHVDYRRLADGCTYLASLRGGEYPFFSHFAMKLFLQSAEVLIFKVPPSGDMANPQSSAEYITGVMSSLYEAFALATDREQQLLVAQRLVTFLSSPVSSNDDTVASFTREFLPSGIGAALGHSMTYVLLIIEYFAVELWNNAVFYLYLTDMSHHTAWRELTWSLLGVLPDSSGVGSTLRALKSTL